MRELETPVRGTQQPGALEVCSGNIPACACLCVCACTPLRVSGVGVCFINFALMSGKQTV